MMTFAQIQTFLAVARLGNFHAAARQLNVTQAAVSARVRQLEDELDLRLFERGRKGAELTEAGRFLLPGAEAIASTWTTISKDARHFYAGRVPLRLGGQLSIWDQQLVDLVIWVEETLGALPLALNFDHEMNVQDAIRNGVLDFALTHEQPAPDLTGVALPAERLVLVGSEPFDLGQSDLPLFMNFQLGGQYDAFVARHLSGHAGQHIMMGNCAMGLRYLRKRGGIAFFPVSMVVEDIQHGHLFPVQGVPEMELACNAVYHPSSVLGDLTAQIATAARSLRSSGPVVALDTMS